MQLKKYFAEFFYPAQRKYSYKHPKHDIAAVIFSVLDKKPTWLSEQDIEGESLGDDTFTIKIAPSSLDNKRIRSTMMIRLMESEGSGSQIVTKSIPAPGLRIMFFVSLVIGLVWFIQFLITKELRDVFSSLFFLIGLPLFCVGFSRVANAAIEDRFKRFIDKPLRSL